jgi:hydroxymethylpyrimidine pyrophosphatase-like HAD family hydrolase
VRASPAPFTGGPGEAAGGGGSAGSLATTAATAPPPPAPSATAAAASAPTQAPPPQAQQLPIVHVPFRWPAQLGGSRVSVFGSWDGWRQKVPLAKSPVTGDFVRVLALPLDPQGKDGTTAGAAAAAAAAGAGATAGRAATTGTGARQIEYKFEVEYDDDDGEDEDGSDAATTAADGRPSTKTKKRKARVAVRPAPSDPLIRTAAPVFASDVDHFDTSRPSSPYSWTESHANNKRLLAPNKFFVLPGGAGPKDEVLAVSDYGGWHAAIPLAWNPRAKRHEAAASLPAGCALSYRFLVNGRPALAPGGLLPVAPAPPPAPAGRLAHRDAALPPARAFTLFYATGWPSATLIYRFRLPHLAARAVAAAAENGGDGGRGGASSPSPSAVPVTPWQQLPMDVAPSRDAPNGGRWMTAVIEPPPALRRDPWLLERRAEAEAEELGLGAASAAGSGGNGSGDGGNGSISTANRVAALAAAPSPPCELEFFVRGPPVSPPTADAAIEEAADDGSNAALAAPSPRHPEEDRGPGGGGHYLLPAPMAWKLSRGTVRKFPRALRPPSMLVSDLDHTLYAEGEAAAQALARFTSYWESEAALARSVLVYNTGRSLGQFVSLVNEQRGRLALPDVLVTAVGTKVFHLKAEWRGKGGAFGGGGGGFGGGGNGGGSSYSSSSYSSSSSPILVTEDDWQEDLAWARRLDHGWDLQRARQATERAIADARGRFSRGWGGGEGDPSYLPGDQIANWLDDGSEHPHRVAVSCHVRATPLIVANLRAGMAARGVRARVIVSGAGDWRYVDAVARRAGKAAALEHVRRLYGVQPERTMAAGDSCNDVLMLAAAADGGMAEALAAPMAQAAAAQAAAVEEEEQGAAGSQEERHPHHHDGAAAAAMLMMRDYWAGGGSRTFLDEASDLSSSGAGGSGSDSDNTGGWLSPSASPDNDGNERDAGEEEDGDGGRAPRVRAVIVGNAQRELVEWYHDSLKADTGAASILVAGSALADGVLEGLMRHGLY